MAFSNCANYLITVGVEGEDNLAVFNLSSMYSSPADLSHNK